jgi:uncharacterized protein
MESGAEYKLISCDDHLDLGYLPRNLWAERLPARYAARAPHVEERDGRGMWISDGKVWGVWHGVRPAGAAGPPPYLTALNRGGHWDNSEMRPGTPKLRLEDMDRDGVHTQLIFGPITSILADDDDLRDACHRAYNDWLAEFCSAAPDRFLGVPMLPWSPVSAVAELLRLAKGGRFRQANLQLAGMQPGLHDRAWEPLWNALEETGVILSFHVAPFSVGIQRAPDPAAATPAGTFSVTKAFVSAFLEPFVDLFAWGILERHAKVRIVLAEAGTGWLPWVVEELDYRFWRLWEAKEFWADKGGIALKEKPSALFRRQIYPTFQEDRVAIALVDFYGPDNLMWGSDYPHPDSVWPNSRAAIERQMGHLSAELRRKITHENAAKLYRLSV